MNFPKFSIIIPVKNEEKNLERCLLGIKNLDYPKNKIEVIVADALSKDKTLRVAKKFKAKIVINKKQTVAPGRNCAFKKAIGSFVAFTDADCSPDKKWLKNSLKYFNDKKVAGVGGPNLTPGTGTSFAKAVGFIFNQRIFSAGSIHARVIKKVIETRSLPGCNAIYKKEILDKVMPQDESLLTCDETEMNYRIGDLGYKLLYTPDVFVWHFRRENPKKLFIQMYRYAIGRLQLGKKRRDGMNLIHILVGFSMPLFLLLNFLLFFLNFKLLVYFYFLFSIFYFLLFLKATIETKNIFIGANVIFAIIIISIGWSSGFMRELFFPIKNVEGK